MKMTDTDQNPQQQGDLNLSFENTEVAFSSKSNSDLRKANFLFKALGNNLMMAIGKHATMISLGLRLPVNGMIKATIFNQFCGGETIAECGDTTKVLDKYGIGTILDYSVEGKGSEEAFAAAFEELMRTVETANKNVHIPFCVFKVTGMCSHDLLEKVSNKTELNAEEQKTWEKLMERVDKICKRAWETGTPVFIDAEESWLQPAIDDLAMEMISKYNRKEAVVYNTLQMYRHDRIAHMKEAHAICKENGAIYAVKIVRGAYMEKERLRASEMGYPSPIQKDKPATDRDFNYAVSYCLDNLDEISLCAGTHNEESSMLLAQELNKRGISKSDKRVYFAQLFGMSDHISFNLSNTGHNVAKYVPYGPIREVMPYLIRRAEENTSVAGQTGRELKLIQSEIKRRKSKGNRN